MRANMPTSGISGENDNVALLRSVSLRSPAMEEDLRKLAEERAAKNLSIPLPDLLRKVSRPIALVDARSALRGPVSDETGVIVQQR